MSRLPVEVVEGVVPGRRVRTARRDRVPLRGLAPLVAPGTQRRRRADLRDVVRRRGLAAGRGDARRGRVRAAQGHVPGRSDYRHGPRHWRQRRRR
jgi:hypothetical protein